MNLRFSFLTGDVDWKKYGGKFVSQKLHSGKYHYWLIIDVCEGNGDDMHVYLSAVSLESAKNQLMPAWESCGFDENTEIPKKQKERELLLLEVIITYGTVATLGSWYGKSPTKMKRLAVLEAYKVLEDGLDSRLDVTQNALGNDGHAFLSGDIGFGRREHREVTIPWMRDTIAVLEKETRLLNARNNHKSNIPTTNVIRVAKASMVNGKLVTSDVKMIPQSSLTSDCWLIQFHGLSACDTCDCMHKTGPKKGQRMPRKCGGGETLQKLLDAACDPYGELDSSEL